MHQPTAAHGAYFHKAALLFQPGDRVQPGAWGRLIFAAGPRHQHFYREYIWERVREARYPALPSRMRSAFAFETLQGAEGFFRDGLPEFIYTVDVVGTPTVHCADMSWLDLIMDRHEFQALDDLADHYWRGDVLNPARLELVVDGQLQVVRRVTQIPEDQPPTLHPNP